MRVKERVRPFAAHIFASSARPIIGRIGQPSCVEVGIIQQRWFRTVLLACYRTMGIRRITTFLRGGVRPFVNLEVSELYLARWGVRRFNLLLSEYLVRL